MEYAYCDDENVMMYKWHFGVPASRPGQKFAWLYVEMQVFCSFAVPSLEGTGLEAGKEIVLFSCRNAYLCWIYSWTPM